MTLSDRHTDLPVSGTHRERDFVGSFVVTGGVLDHHD